MGQNYVYENQNNNFIGGQMVDRMQMIDNK